MPHNPEVDCIENLTLKNLEILYLSTDKVLNLVPTIEK